MRVLINKSLLFGIIESSPSKSYTHRSLIMSCFLNKISKIYNPLISLDIINTLESCYKLGKKFIFISNKYKKIYLLNELTQYFESKELLKFNKVSIDEIIIFGSFNRNLKNIKVLNLGNSGTSLRLFMSFPLISSYIYYFDGDNSLRNRPNEILIKTLSDMGCNFLFLEHKNKLPFLIYSNKNIFKNNNSINTCNINGNISSQYISSILISAPLLQNDTIININKPLVSKYYIDITLKLLNEANINIIKKEETKKKIIYLIKGNQKYNYKSIKIPGDFSSASYLIVAATLIKYSNIFIYNLFPSYQSDCKIVNILNKMGASIFWNKIEGYIHVKGINKLNGIDINGKDIPDLIPILVIVGLFASGKTTIYNIEHLKYKETDRIEVISNELKKINIQFKIKKDKIEIYGCKNKIKKKLRHKVILNPKRDHRIVMTFVVLGLIKGNIVIKNCEYIQISYPKFFEDLYNIGALFKIIK